jgi:hypothetical protein
LRPANDITPPTITDATPPIISHIALLVGDPVNARYTLELAESDALKPNTSSTMPTANNASPIALFITFLSL